MIERYGRATAIACIRGDGAHPKLSGTVRFVPQKDGTLIVAKLRGLPENEKGFFGFHIHEIGNCQGLGFPATGTHYDPDQRAHPGHRGDLPPLMADRGDAYMAVLSRRFSVGDVIGKSVVIHGLPDDFTSQPAGNAGEKIACGIIRRSL